MELQEIYNLTKEKMDKTLAVLLHEFAGIRAGRANAAVLDKILVDYYGVPTPIQQMAAISVAEARILNIQPWDISTLRPIEKAIQTSDLGINPTNDGRIIRLIFPPLTEEKRHDLVKETKHLAEQAKIAVRNERRDAVEKLKKAQKASEITEDDLKDSEKRIQDFTDKAIKEVDALTADKEKEIMEI
ncbi:MAG: ribosome recycling factor [Oscillospiraceae bacterium]|jgi:ribosome recycling factor|nr:ribosome recycling factor [Oscillospiraceae bacterium]